MTSIRASIGRAIGAVKIVLRDGRIPRPIRWGGAVGLLPIPGPFDEAVLLLVGGILWLFYRDQLTEAWRSAGRAFPAHLSQRTLTPPNCAGGKLGGCLLRPQAEPRERETRQGEHERGDAVLDVHSRSSRFRARDRR